MDERFDIMFPQNCRTGDGEYHPFFYISRFMFACLGLG